MPNDEAKKKIIECVNDPSFFYKEFFAHSVHEPGPELTLEVMQKAIEDFKSSMTPIDRFRYEASELILGVVDRLTEKMKADPDAWLEKEFVNHVFSNGKKHDFLIAISRHEGEMTCLIADCSMPPLKRPDPFQQWLKSQTPIRIMW